MRQRRTSSLLTQFSRLFIEHSSSPLIRLFQAFNGFIIGVIVATLLQGKVIELLGAFRDVFLIFIFIISFSISWMVFILIQYVQELRKRFDITIKYIDRQTDGQATLFREAMKVIKRSQKRILILNSFIPEIEAKEDTDAEMKVAREAREEYYKAILDRVDKSQEVVYERLLQIEENMSVKDMVQNTGYNEHFHDLIEVRDKGCSRIGFQKVPAKRLTTFVLVDDIYLIWQINELVSGSPKQMQMHGIFIIEDYRGDIIKPFEQFFEAIKRSDVESVKHDELPPRNAKTSSSSSSQISSQTS